MWNPRPFRTGSTTTSGRTAIVLGSLLACAGPVGDSVSTTAGRPARVPEQASDVATEAASAVHPLRIRAVGDTMLGSLFPEPRLPPDDGAAILREVAPTLRDADLTFANLEGTLCDTEGTRRCDTINPYCYLFRSPTRYAAHLATAGIDVVSIANNHGNDFGPECRVATSTALTAAGVANTGERGTFVTIPVSGQRVAVVAFHVDAWANPLLDHSEAVDAVRRADADASIVIVSFHGGTEGPNANRVPNGPEFFRGHPRGDLRAFARAVIGAGADLVLGHGPHVLRGMEVVEGRLVAYSLGNFATYGRFSLSGDKGIGAILDVTLAVDGSLMEANILPTRQVGLGVPTLDAKGAAISTIDRLSDLDFAKTRPSINRQGHILP